MNRFKNRNPSLRFKKCNHKSKKNRCQQPKSLYSARISFQRWQRTWWQLKRVNNPTLLTFRRYLTTKQSTRFWVNLLNRIKKLWCNFCQRSNKRLSFSTKTSDQHSFCKPLMPCLMPSIARLPLPFSPKWGLINLIWRNIMEFMPSLRP